MPTFLVGIFFFSCKSQPSSSLEKGVMEASVRQSVTIYHKNQEFPQGSGLIVGKRGEILTCLHVVAGYENELHISTDGKNYFSVKVIKKEFKFDLVVLQVQDQQYFQTFTNFAPVRWKDRSELSVNLDVYAIASPYGLPRSFLKGYISHTERLETDITYSKIPFIQTIGISFPGVSGAGIFTSDGAFIGINRSTFGLGVGNGIGLVIPAGYVQTFLQLPEGHGMDKK